MTALGSLPSRCVEPTYCVCDRIIRGKDAAEELRASSYPHPGSTVVRPQGRCTRRLRAVTVITCAAMGQLRLGGWSRAPHRNGMGNMAARSVDSVDRHAPGMHSVTGWRAHARRHPLRYRMAIVAAEPIDVVRHAGGWLFDKTTAGWEVTVLVAEPGDIRPLQILGATVLDMEQSLDAAVHETWPNVVAVASETYRQDARIRDGILNCLDNGFTEVALWGDDLPSELEQRVATANHRVSIAARAFKACALRTAGYPLELVGPTEEFRTGMSSSGTPHWGADMMSAS